MKRVNLSEIIKYKPAQLHKTAKSWYIEYAVYNPVTQKLQVKRIKLNRIKNKGERKIYADELMKELNAKLLSGWNPFIENYQTKGYSKFSEVKEHYYRLLERKEADGSLKKNTMLDYKRNINVFERWLLSESGNIIIQELSSEILLKFLETKYLSNQINKRTYNKYIGILSTFATFMVEHSYIKNNFVSVIKRQKVSQIEKVHKLMPASVYNKIFKYLENDKHFLLACYFVYYMYIRPNELYQMQVSWIHAGSSLVIVPASVAKNRRSRKITLPDKVKDLLNELKILKQAKDCYVFSDDFLPGTNLRNRYIFTHHWNILCKKLDIKNYTFYSLKHTGIHNALKSISPVDVKEQAGHHSISMTNEYLPTSLTTANEGFKNIK